jgi:penicillin-binding protein 2
VNTHHPHARRRRAHGAYVVIALFMGTLVVSFFRMQVLRSSVWELKAESNRLRQLPVMAPRGTIYDRYGRILADNVPGYAITILPGPPDSVRHTLERMSTYIDISQQRIDQLVAQMKRYGTEVVVDGDADFDVVSALEERRAEFPDVYIEMRPKRRYIDGPATAHVLGYVGEITQGELASPAFPDDRYEPGMIVGKTGIEREYESSLQGTPGVRYVEVDARGRVVGDFAGVTADPAKPGRDLHLNLDLELQQWIRHIWPDSMAGAVVALDPADGGVLALYSAPTFDPNEFVGGISSQVWDTLNNDPQKPLFNRATMGLYPPASTFKLAVAAIGLELGAVTPQEHMPKPCTGGILIGGMYRHCWGVHGYENLTQAIGNSCDVYFYQLGQKIGLDRLLKAATAIGFSKRCGVDLPQEAQGIFPASRDWWKEHKDYTAQEGEVYSLAIGQGPNSQTPLKMAQFYEALARDGSAPPPTIAQGVDLGKGWSLDLSPANLQALREGLRKVTQLGGTAHYGTALQYWDIIGKTGTAQNALSVQGKAPDHGWFAGIAGPPGEPPEIVVVALVEYSGEGSTMAAPIVAKTADFYLRQKYGIPLDTLQTYLDYIRAGKGVPPWYRERFGGAKQ